MFPVFPVFPVFSVCPVRMLFLPPAAITGWAAG